MFIITRIFYNNMLLSPPFVFFSNSIFSLRLLLLKVLLISLFYLSISSLSSSSTYLYSLQLSFPLDILLFSLFYVSTFSSPSFSRYSSSPSSIYRHLPPRFLLFDINLIFLFYLLIPSLSSLSTCRYPPLLLRLFFLLDLFFLSLFCSISLPRY